MNILAAFSGYHSRLDTQTRGAQFVASYHVSILWALLVALSGCHSRLNIQTRGACFVVSYHVSILQALN